MNWSDLFKVLSGPAATFAAAWTGAYLGFRRSKRERALERRIGWHEQTIQALARYEEHLERLHNYANNALIFQRPRSRPSTTPGGDDLPKTIKVPAALWTDLREAEEPARASLRLAGLYTDLRTQVECSTALSNVVNVVPGQRVDLSPEPEIPWVDLHMKAIRTGTVRTKVQDSLKRVLELDGFIASLIPSYDRWRLLRQLKRMRAEIERGAA